MQFTETNLTNTKKGKKLRSYFIGNPGGYYNVRVPIANHHTAPIAKRINKNMTYLNIYDQSTNKKLDNLLQPVLVNDTNIDDSFLKNEIIKNEKISNIFNYSYDNINLKINENVTLHDFHAKNVEKTEKAKKIQKEISLKLLQLTKTIIENVYQEKYNNDINASGLGDFIRGSYFLMEFCDNNNIPYNINFLNHPISQFLEIYENQQFLVYNNINKFELSNHNPDILDNNIITNIYDYTINDSFLHYLSNQSISNKKLYVYTVSYPSAEISQKHKEYMRKLLRPSILLESLVDNMLLDLGLIKQQFTIIHIRYGDDFLIKNKLEIKTFHLEIISNILDKLDLTQKYLLISDNNVIKNILHLKYSFLKIHLNEISHTGEGLHIETNKLQNTMIDFNLLSHATNVIAFSVYQHGTGFSKWSAETYNVPYVCRFLE